MGLGARIIQITRLIIRKIAMIRITAMIRIRRTTTIK